MRSRPSSIPPSETRNDHERHSESEDARVSRRDLMKQLGLAAVALPVVSALVASVADAAPAAAHSQTFSYTGGAQSFVVPVGVTSVTIRAEGAQGADDWNSASAGGKGGVVTATLRVNPREALAVYVGGRGVAGKSAGRPGAGGFNGGAAGGFNAGSAGGGGGASDIRRGGAALSNRVLVAGGGGAAGMTYLGAGGAGGGGGTTTGGRGAVGGGTAGGGGGQGGTSTAGGAGGAAGHGEGAKAGAAGSVGKGGTGGNDGGAGSGGGGGGGYFGGGGGGGGNNNGGGGGGGGGSSYADSTLTTHVTMAQGKRSGNGQVVIRW